jgi:hypothetical protein
LGAARRSVPAVNLSALVWSFVPGAVVLARNLLVFTVFTCHFDAFAASICA